MLTTERCADLEAGHSAPEAALHESLANEWFDSSVHGRTGVGSPKSQEEASPAGRLPISPSAFFSFTNL